MYLVTFTYERDDRPFTHVLLLTEDVERAVKFIRMDAVNLVQASHLGIFVHDLPAGPGPYGILLHCIEPETPIPPAFSFNGPGTVVLQCWRSTFTGRNCLLIEDWRNKELQERFG